jgi:ATP-dependent RNA helicase DHX57
MKNIHMMLPPTHKTFWFLFEDIKKQEVARNRAWMYEADPFLAKRERDAAETAKAKAAEAGDGKKEKTAPKDDRMKGWTHVPVVDMGSEQRREIEALVRKYHVWNPAGVVMSKEAVKRVMEELISLGFRRAHVLEACEWVKDKEEALGWCFIIDSPIKMIRIGG